MNEEKFIKKLHKIGNSTGIILPPEWIKKHAENGLVYLTIKNNKIIVSSNKEEIKENLDLEQKVNTEEINELKEKLNQLEQKITVQAEGGIWGEDNEVEIVSYSQAKREEEIKKIKEELKREIIKELSLSKKEEKMWYEFDSEKKKIKEKELPPPEDEIETLVREKILLAGHPIDLNQVKLIRKELRKYDERDVVKALNDKKLIEKWGFKINFVHLHNLIIQHKHERERKEEREARLKEWEEWEEYKRNTTPEERKKTFREIAEQYGFIIKDGQENTGSIVEIIAKAKDAKRYYVSQE